VQVCANALRDVQLSLVRDGTGALSEAHAIVTLRHALVDSAGEVPPPPRTKWTRRVPHPVLIGRAAVALPPTCVGATSIPPSLSLLLPLPVSLLFS
jgi:hypothetical protein